MSVSVKANRVLCLLAVCMFLSSLFSCALNTLSTDDNSTETENPYTEPPGDGTPEPDEPSTPDTAEIVFALWGDPAEVDITQKAIDTFNNLPDVKGRIHVTALQEGRDGYDDALLALAARGEMPDCGMISETRVLGFAREGLLLPYDIFDGQADKLLDSLRFIYNGETIAINSNNEVLALWYNKEMFDDAGVDYPPATLADAWTWDEFIEVAKQLTMDSSGNHQGDEGFNKFDIVQYGAYVNQFTFQLEVWSISNGGSWFSSDGNTVVFDDAAIEAIQNVFDLNLVHNVAPLFDGTEDYGFALSLAAGNVAMCTDGQWAAGFRDETVGPGGTGIDYGVGVLPYMKNKANIFFGSTPVGIFAASPHPDEAAEFLRWYIDEENHFEHTEAGWRMPIKKSWYTDEALLKRWVDDVGVRAALPAGRYRTAIVDVALDAGITKPPAWEYTPNTYEVLITTLQPGLVEAIVGTRTVKEVVEACRGQMQAALDG